MSTLGEIVARVRADLKDYPLTGTGEAVGDGVSLTFQLPDYPVVDGSLVLGVSTDGGDPVPTTDFTVDNATGLFTLTDSWVSAPPAESQVIKTVWQYTHWSDEDLMRMVNSAVRYIGKEFYVRAEDETQTVTADSWEYPAPVDAKRILTVECLYIEGDRWKTNHRWKTKEVGEQLYVAFTMYPGECDLRITYLAKVVPFVTEEPDPAPEGWVSVAAQELSDTNLPDDAYEPIAHYVNWMAAEQRVTHRTRDDSAQHQKEETTVTMRDLEARASKLRLLFELHYEQFRSEWINGRLYD